MHTHHIKVRCRAIIIHDNKLLVVRHTGGRDFYALPGGHLDSGEDPKECMRRELIEELGIVPEIGRLLYVHTLVHDVNNQSIEFFFEIKNTAEYQMHHEKEKSHAHEIEEACWISPRDDARVLPEAFHREFVAGRIFDTDVRFLR